jgi:hypothetical protein
MPIPMIMRRWSLRAIFDSQRKGSDCLTVSFLSAASSRRWSRWSRTALSLSRVSIRSSVAELAKVMCSHCPSYDAVFEVSPRMVQCLRQVKQWNERKVEEFKHGKTFKRKRGRRRSRHRKRGTPDTDEDLEELPEMEKQARSFHGPDHASHFARGGAHRSQFSPGQPFKSSPTNATSRRSREASRRGAALRRYRPSISPPVALPKGWKIIHHTPSTAGTRKTLHADARSLEAMFLLRGSLDRYRRMIPKARTVSVLNVQL